MHVLVWTSCQGVCRVHLYEYAVTSITAVPWPLLMHLLPHPSALLLLLVFHVLSDHAAHPQADDHEWGGQARVHDQDGGKAPTGPVLKKGPVLKSFWVNSSSVHMFGSKALGSTALGSTDP